MKSLYFIRHGLSKANVDDVWGGQFDSPLTDKGREQARAAGKKARSERLLFDLIMSSPLSRAQETAKIIATELGYPTTDIIQEELLLERSFGILDGTENARSFFEEHTYEDLDSIQNVETVEELQKRARVALDKISMRDEKKILIVGHGAFGRALRREINGEPYTHEFTTSWEEQHIPNAQIIQLV